MDINEYISLLNDKKNILNEIYNYTKNKTFKKTEDEVDRIEYYLNTRQTMYDKLNIIENKIKRFNFTNNKEVDSIIKQNDKIIKDIIKLDEEKKEIMESILNLLKKEIKSTKSIAKVNNSYFGTYENAIVGGSLFDSSR